jgi:hypothetical protein
MRLLEDRRGQIYTMEGIVASLILLSVLLFVLQSNSIIVPQTERSIDMKLYERTSDTLTCLDWNSNESWSPMPPLMTYITGWDGRYILVGTGVRPGMEGLNSSIASMLPDDVQYNLDLTYYNATGRQNGQVIVNGLPADNAVVSSRLITLHQNDDNMSSYWSTNNRFPQVVEVKLTCWYL